MDAVSSCFGSGLRSPLDHAVIDCCSDNRVQQGAKLDEIPFDFERRSVSVLAESKDERLLIIKGAPEAILARSSGLDLGDGRTRPMEQADRTALDRMNGEQATLSNRLLAVAWKEVPIDRREISIDDEYDLIVAGFCIFVDPPKVSAAAAVARLAAAGVRVKVISGDHEAVVRHVVSELKIPACDLLTGAEIAELTEPALAARVEDVDLFARVSPDQKTCIIRALQARGHTVGFIGDGVNDAPAIRAAEVGFSVEGATDVARSAADMIVLAQDLGVLADGVEEGRRTFPTSSNTSGWEPARISATCCQWLWHRWCCRFCRSCRSKIC